MKALLLGILLLLQINVTGQTRWRQTSASVSFGIKNRGATVNGTFDGVTTDFNFSPDNLGSSLLKGTVRVGTINTGNKMRDKDLQGEKYFDAGKYPTMDITSVSLSKIGSQYSGTFRVTMKGVTKQMVLPFEFQPQNNNAVFQCNFTLNRRDFGIGTKGGLAFFMSDDVHVRIVIKASS